MREIRPELGMVPSRARETEKQNIDERKRRERGRKRKRAGGEKASFQQADV